MSDWPTTTIGQHVTRRIQPVALSPDQIYRSLGIRYLTGVYVRDEKPGRAIRTKMYRVRAGDFIYCILDSQRGPFDIVPAEFDDAIVTNKFPTYEVGPDLLAEFLQLNFQDPNTLNAISKARRGAEGRSEWKPEQFEAHTIPLPPIEVQQRIVDIMAAVDDLRVRLAAETVASTSARTAILHGLLSTPDNTWTVRAIGDLGPVRRGKRFTKAQYVDDGTPCIHYAQIHTDFGALATETRNHVPAEMNHRLRFAQPGALVIAGTSETRKGVLKAVAWMGDGPVAVHDDAYILSHSIEPRFASYLFASPAFRQQVAGVLSDTKVVRVARADLERLTVPVPPRETQEAIADTIEAIDHQTEALKAELAQAKVARDAVLEQLLSGAHGSFLGNATESGDG